MPAERSYHFCYWDIRRIHGFVVDLSRLENVELEQLIELADKDARLYKFKV